MYYTQGPDQEYQIQQVLRIQERRWENLQQTQGEHPTWEKGKESFQQKEERKQELCTFEKMDVSGSEESNQSLDDSNASSKSDDSWNLGSNKSYLDNIKHSRNKFK